MTDLVNVTAWGWLPLGTVLRAKNDFASSARIEYKQFWFGRLWVLLCSIRVEKGPLGWLTHFSPAARLRPPSAGSPAYVSHSREWKYDIE